MQPILRICALWLLISALPVTATVPETGVVWAPQSVNYPVDPSQVIPAPPFVPEGSRETERPVEVGPGVGATFFLDGLEFARVRVLSGHGTPRFQRVFGGSRSSVQTGLRALIDSGAQHDADGSWRIVEPAGDGDVWCIDADAPVRIVIEHPRTLPARLSWEEARQNLIDAIRKDQVIPHLPGDTGSAELEATLTAYEALGRQIVATGGADLSPAVQAWQVAAALRRLDEIRPFAWPYWSVDDVGEALGSDTERILRVNGEVASSAVWRRVEGQTQPTEIEVEGPGILRVEVRSVLPAGWLVAPTPTTTKVFRDGVLAKTLVFTGRPARVTDEPNAAFPIREYLVTRQGEWAGKINEIRLPLAPGKHRYQIQVDQTSLLRVARAQRKSFAYEDLKHEASPEDWVSKAYAALEGKQGPEADLLRGLIADVVGEPPPPQSGNLPVVLQPVAEYLAAAYGKMDATARVGAWTTALAGETAPPWAWWLRVRMAELLPSGVGVRALFAAANDLPPPGLTPAAAEHLGAPGLYQDRPDRALGMLELAWRELPGDLGIRKTYLSEFLDGSSWSRQSPVVMVNGDAITPPPMTWLDTAAGTGGPVSRAARVFYRVPGGATRTLAVDASTANPSAPAIFSMFLRSPIDSGLAAIAVDDHNFRVLPVSDIERLDMAVKPGEHTISLNTNAGTDAWVSGYPTQEQWRQTTDIASLRSYWPNAIGGNALHFELPSPQVPVPVRIEVRVLDPIHHPNLVVGSLHSDSGASWPLTVVPGIADPTLLPIGGEEPLSGVATVTVYPPAGTQQMWVEAPADAGWVVSMSVRRTETLKVATTWESKGLPDLATIASLSKEIALHPNDASALLHRADALAQLGDLDMARQDLRRLLRLGAQVINVVPDEAVEEVSDRIDAVGSSGWLPPTLALAQVTSPVPLSAALVLGEDAAPPTEIIQWVNEARKKGAAAGLELAPQRLGAAPGVDWLRARFLHDLHRDVEGALALVQAWRSSGRWQYGLEAANWLVSSEVGSGQSPIPGSASLGYGLAAELRSVIEHPTIERLALLSGRRTRWDPIRGADSSAGRALLTTKESLTPPLPQTEIRQALTTAPWPQSEAQFVTAKEPAAVSINGISQVIASAWCQPLRLSAGAAEPSCVGELFVDGVSVLRQNIPLRSSVDFKSPQLAPGRHEIQMAIDDPGRTAALSVRFRDAASSISGRPIQPLRDTTGFFATPDQAFSVVVAGPGTVFVELRAAGSGGTVNIRAQSPTLTLPDKKVILNAAQDRTVSMTGGPVSVPGVAQTFYVVLPTAGTWRVQVQPQNNAVLVRGAYRQETPAPTIQRPGPIWRDIDPRTEPVDWPATVPPMGAPLAGDAPYNSALGTFSLGLAYGQQSQEATVDAGAEQFEQAQVSLAWRLQAIPNALWLHLEPLMRAASVSSDVYGARADVLGRFLGPDLRLHGNLESYSQVVEEHTERGSTFSLRAYRPVRSVGGTYIIPSLEARVRQLTMDQAPLTELVDSDVFNDYAVAHPLAITPSVVYWAMPWQDVIAYTSLSAVSNPNIFSFDQVAASFVGRGVVHPSHLPPAQLEFKYRASYRFVSDYRLEAYLQHSLGASLGTDIKMGNSFATWVGLSYLGYFSATQANENILKLEARFDFNGGRGLDDMLPVEQDFFDLLGKDRWGDLNEDGP